MTQTYKISTEIKTPELEEIKQPEVQAQIENEVDELLGDLNPRYNEEAITMKEAKDRIHSAQSYSNFSFNTYGF